MLPAPLLRPHRLVQPPLPLCLPLRPLALPGPATPWHIGRAAPARALWRRVAARAQSYDVNQQRGTAVLRAHDDAESAAIRADIAEIVAKFSDDDLRNALIAATEKVWGESEQFRRETIEPPRAHPSGFREE